MHKTAEESQILAIARFQVKIDHLEEKEGWRKAREILQRASIFLVREQESSLSGYFDEIKIAHAAALEVFQVTGGQTQMDEGAYYCVPKR